MKKYLEKYSLYIICLLLLIIGVLLFLNFNNEECDSLNEVQVFENVEKEISKIYVDIKGEVLKPGVYEIDEGSRIIDVIDIAGGLTKNSDTSLLNLSKKVMDEMNIKIYSKEEVKEAINGLEEEPEVIEIIKEIEKECICPDMNDACINQSKKEETQDDDSNMLININTSDKEDLMNIPGIGESKANSIIEYRNDNSFQIIDDIKNVSGIGDSLFEKIKEYIKV